MWILLISLKNHSKMQRSLMVLGFILWLRDLLFCIFTNAMKWLLVS